MIMDPLKKLCKRVLLKKPHSFYLPKYQIPINLNPSKAFKNCTCKSYDLHNLQYEIVASNNDNYGMKWTITMVMVSKDI